jgi:hypothetical protein
MENKKIILVITLLTLAMSSPASPDRAPLVPGKTGARAENISPLSIKQDLIVIAENEQAVADSKSQAAGEKSEEASGSGVEATENSVKNSNEAETKPLKPFVPSEKIAAEQAVDFPVDI